jgi:hypothetical protein
MEDATGLAQWHHILTWACEGEQKCTRATDILHVCRTQRKPFRLSSTHCCARIHTHIYMVVSLWLETAASTDCRVEDVHTALAAAVKAV